MITKLIFILFMCLTISCASIAPSATIPPKQDTSKTYNFDFYTNHLSKGLFLEIEKTVKPHKKFLTQQDAKELADKVFDCVWKYLEKHQLYISQDPKVQVFKLSGHGNVAFVLKVELHFLDKESSFKDLINTVIFTKKFLIFFAEEQTGAGI